MENIDTIKQLLEEFQKLPKKEKVLPTYLEIAGKPHFENVCSNILRFFFDTRESHKFNDLLLKSFLNCVDDTYATEHNLETINIYREYSAIDNKRIDLVIECENLVIVIENKIFHCLDNKLDLYKKTIIDNYKKTDKKSVFIVLSLRKETNITKPFFNVTYCSFFENLKSNLGYYFVNTNNQYTTFLLDFIKTIENLMSNKNINIDKDYFEFYVQNKTQINELVNKTNELENNRVKIVNEIATILISNNENISLRMADKNNIYIKITLDKKITLEKVDLEFQCYFGLTDVISFLRLYNYKGNGYDILDELQLIKDNPNFRPMDKKYVGYVIYEEPQKLIDINPVEFADKIIDIIDKIKFN